MKSITKITTLTLAAVFVLGTAATVSAQSGYGGGTRTKNVEICHNGKNLRVPNRAVKAFLNDGATMGVCVAAPAPQVLGTATVQFNNNLSRGMTSNEVKQLQEVLRAKGFFTSPTATGFFGPLTLSSVRDFQSSRAIPKTGFVGPLTRAALNAS